MLSFSSLLFMFLLSLGGGDLIAQAPAQTANPPAITSFNEEQLDRYIAAVGAIERKREEILRRAKKSEAWASAVQLAEAQNKDICRVPVEQQAVDIKNLCAELLEFSEREIRKQGLTNREFNQITTILQRDRQLQSRIQSRLQKLRTP
jgi:hypothetical protein